MQQLKEQGSAPGPILHSLSPRHCYGKATCKPCGPQTVIWVKHNIQDKKGMLAYMQNKSESTTRK